MFRQILLSVRYFFVQIDENYLASVPIVCFSTLWIAFIILTIVVAPHSRGIAFLCFLLALLFLTLRLARLERLTKQDSLILRFRLAITLYFNQFYALYDQLSTTEKDQPTERTLAILGSKLYTIRKMLKIFGGGTPFLPANLVWPFHILADRLDQDPFKSDLATEMKKATEAYLRIRAHLSAQITYLAEYVKLEKKLERQCEKEKGEKQGA